MNANIIFFSKAAPRERLVIMRLLLGLVTVGVAQGSGLSMNFVSTFESGTEISNARAVNVEEGHGSCESQGTGGTVNVAP